MDPLVIADDRSQGRDPLLIDRMPITDAEFLPNSTVAPSIDPTTFIAGDLADEL